MKQSVYGLTGMFLLLTAPSFPTDVKTAVKDVMPFVNKMTSMAAKRLKTPEDEELKNSIFTAADYLNVLLTHYKDECNLKENLQKVLTEEKKHKETVQKENARLKETVQLLKRDLMTAEKKVEAQLSDLQQIRREKEDLSSKTQAAGEKEKEYLKKMEALEKSWRQIPPAQDEKSEEKYPLVVAENSSQTFMRTSTPAPSSPR